MDPPFDQNLAILNPLKRTKFLSQANFQTLSPSSVQLEFNLRGFTFSDLRLIKRQPRRWTQFLLASHHLQLFQKKKPSFFNFNLRYIRILITHKWTTRQHHNSHTQHAQTHRISKQKQHCNNTQQNRLTTTPSPRETCRARNTWLAATPAVLPVHELLASSWRGERSRATADDLLRRRYRGYY